MLIEEEGELAALYANKSIAEQNSIDIAWDLLGEPKYSDLRGAIYSNQVEYDRFRALVVNAVIATDIFDKDQKQFRQQRWDRAFGENREEICTICTTAEQKAYNAQLNNLKATIVIEHLIQASDVAHTMQ